MTTTYRISHVDRIGNRSFVWRTEDGRVHCSLANGTPASLFYAGVLADEQAVRFRLEDAKDADAALAVLRANGSGSYEVFA